MQDYPLPVMSAAMLADSVPIVGERYGSDLPTLLIVAYVLMLNPLLCSVERYILSRHDSQRFNLQRLVGSVATVVMFLELHTPPATNLTLMANEAGVYKEYTGVALMLSCIVYGIALPVYLAAFLELTR